MSTVEPPAPAAPRPIPPPRRASRQDTVTVAGEVLRYTVTAETVHLSGPPPDAPDGPQAPRAAVFAVSYVLEDVPHPEQRPVTFCFNGGPGSASVWLHLGALGPRRVEVPDAAMPAPPRAGLVENPDGLLDRTDLVFIDPVGTGFSETVGEGKRADYLQVDGDIASIVAFIEQWLTLHGRWASPKLLAGESYGTTRGAGIAHQLAERGIMLSGLLLFSVAFDFGTFVFGPSADLPYALILPTYTAVAAWHGQLPDPVEAEGHGALLDEARAFAGGEYLTALFKGASLPHTERLRVAGRLAALTGIDADVWVRNDLRLDQARFCKLLLGRAGRVVGRLDGRYTGRDDDPQAARASRDPSYDGPIGPFAVAINDYLRRHIGYDDPRPYASFSLPVNDGWTVDRPWWQGHIDTSSQLRSAMLANPHLQVFVASGYTDLATPFFATEYSLDHLAHEPELRSNVHRAYYDAGHMMYLHPASRRQLRADMLAFFDGLPG